MYVRIMKQKTLNRFKMAGKLKLVKIRQKIDSKPETYIVHVNDILNARIKKARYILIIQFILKNISYYLGNQLETRKRTDGNEEISLLDDADILFSNMMIYMC